MNPAQLRRFAVAVVIATVISVPSYAAAKRRAVGHRTPPVPITGTVTGTVTDAVTGAPVVALTVSIGIRSGATDAQGKFEVKNVTGAGTLEVKTDRSGYLPTTTVLGPNDPKILSLRVTPTPTITVRRTNGQTVQIDTESMKFGYPVPFSGYRDSEFEDFCKADGTKVRYNNSELKRLVGPATSTSAAACCSGGDAMRMTVTLRTGETSDLVFTDTCAGRETVDLGGRNHTTGDFEHIVISEIAEIVFP